MNIDPKPETQKHKSEIEMTTQKKLTAAMAEMDRVTPRPLTHEDYAKVAIDEIKRLSNISTSDDQEKINQLISGITVNPANLQFIIENGKINGNMMMEIGYAMSQYATYRMDKTLSGGMQNLH